MRRLFVAVTVLAAVLAAWPGLADGHTFKQFGAGAPGIGDPYFPLDGNGGYDVRHYDLDVSYNPATDVLRGEVAIRARATQNLSRFNLDLHGLNVRSISVDGRRATWSRDGDELQITPRRGIHKGERFRTVIVYEGVPETIGDSQIGLSGFIHTDDGTLVAGQPDVAATWYPVNDHPLDKASYTFRVTVPKGLEAVANGVLKGKWSRHGKTTWLWDAREPMASYLTTASIGEFDLSAYKADGIRYWDAIDPDLLKPFLPRHGERYAFSGAEDGTHKRLTRTFDIPAGGGELSFWINRDTEYNWDYVFVEAHRPGSDEWATLPDLNGHTSNDTGNGCLVFSHPFLEHYMTPTEEACEPTGTTGEWNAATGSPGEYEQWRVDLSEYANGPVEIAISVATDGVYARSGAYVDAVHGPGEQGTTSFETTTAGWAGDWSFGTAADAPPTQGESAQASLARQPEIIAFLEDFFGPYPFSAAGAVIDDVEGTGFALENQTRPVYARDFFSVASPLTGDSVVVHELAHQWTGDYLALAGWQHIWLNEGFATYTEWLWAEREGIATTDEIFAADSAIPSDDPFWALAIGDPGPDALFDGAVYERGAMTLHALRREIGDEAFFRLVRRWIRRYGDGNVTTPQFVALAEQVSGQQLDDFFETWLFTPAKPAGLEPEAGARKRSAAVQQRVEQVRKAVKR